MTRLLCIGHAPLPHEPSRLLCSGSLRTWHFVKPLLDAGHEVRLVAARVPGSGGDESTSILERRDGRLHYFSAGFEHFEDDHFLRGHLEEFDPDAVVGINNYPSSRAARLPTDVPLWCDLNGWAMAEAQTKAVTHGDDLYLAHFWNMERAILDRADVVSSVSEAQAHAVVGELASRGRLGRQTVGYDFCRTIPNALLEPYGAHDASRVGAEGGGAPPKIRGALVPHGAFVLLWSGGYNTWTDVDLLVEALCRAMDALDDLHFVSTGGALPGHDELTFERFRRRVAGRGFDDRLHFTGWLPTPEVPHYYAAADLGLNIDRRCYEATYGARNRINDMVAGGLPMLTTLGTEVSRHLASRDLVIGSAIGDVDAFVDAILDARGRRDALRAMAGRARRYARREFSYAKTTRPLVAWAEAPRRAPDRGRAVDLDPSVDLFHASPTMVKDRRRAADGDLWSNPSESAERRCRRLEAQLDEITGSRFFRLWMRWVKIRRALPGGLNRGDAPAR
ncbi:MAG: glycosyltransferase [Acidobacteriota bacterium]